MRLAWRGLISTGSGVTKREGDGAADGEEAAEDGTRAWA
jgi:hypothetical protein